LFSNLLTRCQFCHKGLIIAILELAQKNP